MNQEICSSPGCLSRGHHCAVVFSPFGDAPMTRIVVCKEGKEISVQPKEGNKLVYDSPHPVSRESSGAFSCHYQLMDNNNQDNPPPPTLPRGSLTASQEICSFPGILPAPRLFLERLSVHQGDTAVLSCLVPLDIPMTRIVFCKDGKEISVPPKERNKLVYDSPHPVSRESSGAFSCRYQLKDDNNQENNSLPSDESSPTPVRNILTAMSQMDPAVLGMAALQGRLGPKALGLIVGLAVTAGAGGVERELVVSHCRTHRDPSPDRSSLAAENQIQCAEVTRAGADQ
ncbi:unnamed protein product [Lepidochelys kempii]